MSSLMLTGPVAGHQLRHGRRSDVAISKNVSVRVYDASLSRDLWCTVGVFNEDSSSMEWGENHSYGNGKQPSVALITKDEKLYVIEVHRSHLQKLCYYRIGTVSKDDKIIEWIGSEKSLCLGVKPKVSATNSGKIVVVHEQKYSLFNHMKYHIGKLEITEGNPSEASINISRSSFIVNVGCENLQGVEPNITISEAEGSAASAILIYRNGFNRICSNLGTFVEDDQIIRWHGNQAVPGTGINPCISLNSHDNLVESHQTKIGRHISFNYGRISQHEIIWGNPMTHYLGEYPSIALSDEKFVVALHKTCFGQTLHQSYGELKGGRPAHARVQDS